jgi:ATP-dependent DNA ligase
VSLPLSAPYAPMEALLVEEIPVGREWQYEPKWDGFRCLVFRQGDSIELQSKAGHPLARYFPEVVENIRSVPANTFVLDGEIVVPVGNSSALASYPALGSRRRRSAQTATPAALSFDDLLQRIHPADSRIRKLSQERPARLIVFDMLVDPNRRLLVARPLRERRRALEAFARDKLKGIKGVQLSPVTSDVKVARGWLSMAGGALDGIVAKRLDFAYRSGERTGMQKVKRLRSADCVVGGFRYASKARVVGSLLLGLYDEDDLLHHVGFTAGFPAHTRKALLAKVRPLVKPPGFTGRAPGGSSRWSTMRSTEWEPLAPRLVVEVAYDHFTGGRFRHGTRFLRWRSDKPPRQCTLDQVQVAPTSASLPPRRMMRGRPTAT